MRRYLPLAVAIAIACVLSFYKFGTVPVNLGGDEAQFGINGYAIASTGHDVGGRYMPLFLNLAEPAAGIQSSTIWYQPTLFYLTAVVLKFVPLSEASVRLPTALIAIVDVVLLYVVALRIFGRRDLAIAAALMLALSPAHLIFSRQALDYICPLPFVLGWLWCVSSSLDADRRWLAAGAGVLLGLATFSYIAAWAFMPIFLALTWFVYWRSGRGVVSMIAVTLGAAVPLGLASLWLLFHPEMLRDTVARYHLYDTRHLNWLQGVKDFSTYANLQDRVDTYWSYFSPAYLFLTGGANMTTGTRHAGVFLWPLALLIVAGFVELAKRVRTEPLGTLLIAGFLLAPAPATFFGERFAIQRELVLLPFGALIATAGIRWFASRSTSVATAALVVLLVAVPLQFVAFARDYFDEYQRRAAIWFDPTDFRDVAGYVLSVNSERPVPTIYLSDDLDDAKARWRFYLTAHQQVALLDRTRYFDARDVALNDIAPGSLLVVTRGDRGLSRLLGDGHCTIATTIIDAAGSKTALVLVRAD